MEPGTKVVGLVLWVQIRKEPHSTDKKEAVNPVLAISNELIYEFERLGTDRACTVLSANPPGTTYHSLPKS